MVKADGSVSIHADDRAYKPLNWMSPPCRVEESPGVWRVVNKAGEELRITLEEVLHDSSHELGIDPGLVKDGVEAHLQELLAAEPRPCWATGFTLVRREYPTAIGPVDLLCRDAAERDGGRRDQAPRRDRRRRAADAVPGAARTATRCWPRCAGVFAAQEIKPQARVLAEDRGIRCVVLDYDALRGVERDEMTLF